MDDQLVFTRDIGIRGREALSDGETWSPGDRHTEGSRDTNDESLALERCGQIDLVAGGGLIELDIGDLVTNLDHLGG